METGPPDRTLKLFPPPLLQLCGLVGKRISSMHQQKKKGGGGGGSQNMAALQATRRRHCCSSVFMKNVNEKKHPLISDL